MQAFKDLFPFSRDLNIVAGSGEGGLHSDFYEYAPNIITEVASGRFGVDIKNGCIYICRQIRKINKQEINRNEKIAVFKRYK